MSHFTTLRTEMTASQFLVAALADLGFSQVEVSDHAQHLYGYRGDQRGETAEVIIRRRFLSAASNDIGFKRRENGSFDAIISEYDRLKYSSKWVANLKQRYAYHASTTQLEEQGFEITDERVGRNGEIHLTLRRMK